MMNLTDHFLVAMPGLNDEIFWRSVVYIASHNVGAGSIGVMVNKPLDRKLKNAFKGLDFAEYNPKWSENLLYLGGPVHADNGFVLHKASHFGDGGLFSLTNDSAILGEIAASNAKGDLFVSVGYSAWVQSQLEAEIAHNDWLVVKASLELIYDVDPSQRYQEALKLLGINNMGKLYTSEPGFA